MADPRAGSEATAQRSGWARTGAWTILDQALFAGANFVVNVLLARWLDPSGYGAYTVAFTVFLLLGTVHGGFLVEPMMVFGAGRFQRRLRDYLRVLLSGHLRLALVFGALLGLGALGAELAGERVLAHALAAFAVGQGAILFQWTMRSACYIRTQPVLASASDALYAALLVAGVVVLEWTDALGVVSAILLVAGASLVTGTVTAWRLGVPRRLPADPALAEAAYGAHRGYGGWAAATGGLEWVNGFLPFLLLPIWAGLAEVGALRALFNLVLPVVHVTMALSKLILPILVRTERGRPQNVLALKIGAVLMGGAALWAVGIALFGRPVFSLLYDGTYDAWAGLLWLVAVLPMAWVMVHVAMAVLRARERPEAVFSGRLAGAAWVTTVGTALVAFLGVAGALLADLTAVLVEVAVMVRLIRRDAAPAVSGGLPGAAGDGLGRRRRLLVAAYDPGPDAPGWPLATALAERFDVTVLTTSGHREAIDRALAARPVPGLTVVYPRLPGERRQRSAPRTGRGLALHRHLWQIAAGAVGRRLHAEDAFDVTLHLAPSAWATPSAAAVAGVPFVWGPLGGGEAGVAARLPSVRWAARMATQTLALDEATARAVAALGSAPARVLPAGPAARAASVAEALDAACGADGLAAEPPAVDLVPA